jgi:DNA-binding NarL/FixJ family response regulator
MATRTIAVVAERQNFYNAGLAAMLEREVGFTEVIRAHDYLTLVNILAHHCSVDFLALDFELPGASGLATISALREKHAAMRIAVFSESTDLRDVLSILAAGAHGFIPKQMTDCAELLRALRTVEEAGMFIPSSLVGSRRRRDDEGDDAATNGHGFADLTERQQQVIKLLTEGHANKVIARELGISPSTVKVHVHAAFRALGVHSRLAALAALRSTQPTSARLA